MTAPTTAPITVDEVQSNEALRNNLKQMSAAAASGQDALAAIEEALAQVDAARQQIAAASQASADGVSARRFDANATSAAHAVNDQISAADIKAWQALLSQWAETFDNAQTTAEQGHAALEQYRDAEEVVASNNVDASTLENTAA